MSSPRVQKIFQGVTDQVRKLGKYKVDVLGTMVWQGRDATGKDACVLDFTSATWATGNKRAILVAEPASDLNDTAAMKTQSHASGHFIDGSVRFQLYMETPANWTGEHAKFQRDMIQHLRGQLGAPVQLNLTTNGTQMLIDGVNGHSGASVTGTAAEMMLPYGLAYTGGV